MEIRLEVFYHILSCQLSNFLPVLLPKNSFENVSFFKKQKGTSVLLQG